MRCSLRKSGEASWQAGTSDGTLGYEDVARVQVTRGKYEWLNKNVFIGHLLAPQESNRSRWKCMRYCEALNGQIQSPDLAFRW